MKKYVVTGGPCSGKTTTTKILGDEGYIIVNEAAREVINNLIKNGDDIVTWQGNVTKRQSKILDMQLKLEKKAEEQAVKENKKIIFLDRGIPDGITFYQISNTKIPKKLLEESKQEKRNYSKIFFLEPVPYKMDSARKEPPEIAKKITELIYKTYKDLGYAIANVPLMNAQERVKFIKENL